MLEEKVSALRFPARRRHVKKYLELLVRDGPLQQRIMCFGLIIACLFLMAPELAFAGKVKAAMLAAADDDA